MDAASSRATPPDTALQARCANGSRLTLHAPILGTACDRCGQSDDICFLVEHPDGSTAASGGLCTDCLVPLLLWAPPSPRA